MRSVVGILLVSLSAVVACSNPPEGPFDLQGEPFDLFVLEARAKVLIFTRSDCPIANRYAPELARLYHKFSERNVRFWLVYPDDRENAANVRAHLREFDQPLNAVLDPSRFLVKWTGATTSPEAAVLDAESRLTYRGRIDDRFPAFGVSRPPVERDLERAIEAILAGAASGRVVTTEAVGCYLSDL